MPTSVLNVETNAMRRIDTRNVSTLRETVLVYTNRFLAGREPFPHLDAFLEVFGLNRGRSSLGKPKLEVVK
jgi:hypothetical protein